VLLIVLLLVLAAAGVLAGAVLTGHPDWAWSSVLLSGLGLLVLTVDRLRRRAAKPVGDAEESREPEFADANDEPSEEGSSAADAAATGDLDEQVLVVDERPRYHLRTCAWLGDRKTVSLPLREARELGFTPCAMCSPNTTLAARLRRTG
jgi:hypothetical protein